MSDIEYDSAGYPHKGKVDPTPTPSGEACAACKSLGLSARDCERGRIHAKAEPAQPAGTQATYHELKTWPEYFASILSGEKHFEIRKNDRNFNVGDVLILKEYEPKSQTYSGREYWVRVTYLVSGTWGIPADIAVMSIKPEVEAFEPSPATETAREWLSKSEFSIFLSGYTGASGELLIEILEAYHAAQSAAERERTQPADCKHLNYHYVDDDDYRCDDCGATFPGWDLESNEERK